MIIYAPDRNGKKYLINTLLTPMEKKALLALQAARNRCKNPKCTHYEYYGGRGIAVCQQWIDSFEAFVADIGLPAGPEYSLERLDNDKGYEPGNVKWALIDEQHRNRSCTRWVDLGDGRKMMMADVARMAGVTTATIFMRLKWGWTGDKLVAGPWGNAKHGPDEQVTIEGVTKTVQEWSDELGITWKGFVWRMEHGATGSQLLATAQEKNVGVTIKGVTKTYDEWAKQIGIDKSTFRKRVKRGLKGAALLAPPTEIGARLAKKT